jgi:hypothetical protein
MSFLRVIFLYLRQNSNKPTISAKNGLNWAKYISTSYIIENALSKLKNSENDHTLTDLEKLERVLILETTRGTISAGKTCKLSPEINFQEPKTKVSSRPNEDNNVTKLFPSPQQISRIKILYQ